MSRRSNPREKDVNNASYRQVSNYLSNELGIDRKFVEDVIERKMESRNIPAMINRMVQRYFYCDPSAYNAKSRAEERLNRNIDYEFERMMKTEAGEYLQKAAKELTKKIMENALAEAQSEKAESLPKDHFSVIGFVGDGDENRYETYANDLPLEEAKTAARVLRSMCQKNQIVGCVSDAVGPVVETVSSIKIMNERTGELISNFL